jgi:hypothetical protein
MDCRETHEETFAVPEPKRGRTSQDLEGTSRRHPQGGKPGTVAARLGPPPQTSSRRQERLPNSPSSRLGLHARGHQGDGSRLSFFLCFVTGLVVNSHFPPPPPPSGKVWMPKSQSSQQKCSVDVPKVHGEGQPRNCIACPCLAPNSHSLFCFPTVERQFEYCQRQCRPGSGTLFFLHPSRLSKTAAVRLSSPLHLCTDTYH